MDKFEMIFLGVLVFFIVLAGALALASFIYYTQRCMDHYAEEIPDYDTWYEKHNESLSMWACHTGLTANPNFDFDAWIEQIYKDEYGYEDIE